MKKYIYNVVVLTLLHFALNGQTLNPVDPDAIIADSSVQKFNGIVLIAQKGKPAFMRVQGYADIEKQKNLNAGSQFVIGSVSKQITAVMVLLEYEKGNLQLHVPIRTYLPELKMLWADTVTVHHLLIHMHGIRSLDEPLLFAAGTRFDYGLSNTGYALLSAIVEKVSQRSFADGSADLFRQCGMKNTFHPDTKGYHSLVNGYTRDTKGQLVYETESFANAPAAGSFVSTAGDLLIWNEHLHGGKILKPETYRLMTTRKQGAVRQHPIFGSVEYGYGITLGSGGAVQLGQTGFAPGFVSMNFYFPESQTSVIVLENIVYAPTDLKQTFNHHIRLLTYIQKVLTDR